jgi:hypothetical protein
MDSYSAYITMDSYYNHLFANSFKVFRNRLYISENPVYFIV